jgi:pilus assembly protein CpaC
MLMTEKIKKTLALALSLTLFAGLLPLSSGEASAQSMSVVDLAMTMGKSLVIDYPVDIGRISTSNPDVVDAVPATGKEFLLHGKGHGAATVVVWAKNGARTMYNVTVEHNLEPIRKLLSETFPNEDIRIQSGRDSISLVGRVTSKEVADRAVAIATPLAKTVVSNLQLIAAPMEKQIMLRVKFAELNRNAASQFGVNLFSTGAANTIGATSTGQFPAPSAATATGTIGGALAGSRSNFSISDMLNVFAFRPDLNLGAVIRALQNQDLLQILAEPNLVTLNGKEATFLVGGEFPVPILQGGGNGAAVTVQFREFGIRLTFNPLITANGTIRMYVKPEVSTIDLSNAVQLSGFSIPALATRRMETNVELKEGQSFAVGGLMDDRVTEQMSKVPGLASIPILGQLFKTRIERKQKTELIIIVTPEIVKPYNPDDKLPLPDFPKDFLDVNKFKRTSSAKPADNPIDPKDKDADKVKTAEAGGKKSLFFWRNAKAPSADPVPTPAAAASSSAPASQPVPPANPDPSSGPSTVASDAKAPSSIKDASAAVAPGADSTSPAPSPAPSAATNTAPTSVVPNAAPANTAPANTAPANTSPANTAPANTAPANTAPANAAEPAPSSPAPAGPTPLPVPTEVAPAAPPKASPSPVPSREETNTSPNRLPVPAKAQSPKPADIFRNANFIRPAGELTAIPESASGGGAN